MPGLKLHIPTSTYPNGDSISTEKNIGQDHTTPVPKQAELLDPSPEEKVFAALDLIEKHSTIEMRVEGQGQGRKFVFKVPGEVSRFLANGEINPAYSFAKHEIALKHDKKNNALVYTIPATSIHSRDHRYITADLTHYPNIRAAILNYKNAATTDRDNGERLAKKKAA